jgi:uncharacterized membrane protein
MANPSYGRAFVPRPRPNELAAPPSGRPVPYAPAQRPDVRAYGRVNGIPEDRCGIVENSRARVDRNYPRPRRPRRNEDRRAINWLLIIPIGMPLLVPLYNRVDPKLAGIPFFYWYQMATALVAIVVMTFLYQVTKDKN